MPRDVCTVSARSQLPLVESKPRSLTELTDAVTATFATGVTAYRLRAGTLYFSLDTADGLYGYPPGIYSTAFP